jgi:peroxiredoxin
MKRVFYILMSCFFTGFGTSQAQIQKMISISGKIADHGTYTEIFLDSLGAQESVNVTLAPIAADGSFMLKTLVLKTDIYKLRLEDNNFIFMVISPGENITLQIAGPKLDFSAKIKGSPQTVDLYSTMNAIVPYNLRMDSLNAQYKAVVNTSAQDSQVPIIISAMGIAENARKSEIASRIRKNPASLAWLFFIDKFDISSDFEVMDILDQGLNSAYPQNVYVNQFHKQVAEERRLGIGQEAPEISVSNPDGKIVSLSSLRGNIVLIDFWASWCGPCRKENPNVVKLYEKYHSKGFEVFSVSLDKSREAWIKAIADDHLTWTHVSDLGYWKSAPALLYGVSSIPFTVLIDRNGKIIAKKLRGESLEQKLEELLR